MAPHDPGGGSATAVWPDREPVIGRVEAPGIHVMSWNIRRPVPAAFTRAADRWSERAPRLRALLAVEQPTVLCAQEVLAEQIPDLLAGLGRGVEHVGHGRGADGRGEACPIFYDAARLELRRWGQSALSDTPGRPGSRSWGNLFPRVLVTALLRDRVTGHELLVINTHLDPLSGRSRLRAARAIRELVAAPQVPAVVAGDLNSGPADPAVRELLAEGTLVDGWSVAQRRRTGQWGTYAAYREPRTDGVRIDWILATPRVCVTDAAINPTRHGGGWASDHLPVQAVVRPDGGRAGERGGEGASAT